MLRNSRLLKSLLGANVTKEWFTTLALRSFHISVLILKPNIFLKTFFISKFRWTKRVSNLLLDYQADRKNLKRWCEIILLASFVAEKSLLDPQRWDTSLLKLAISVTLLSLIQKGIEREKSFNFALCVFSPDHFCEKILPTASSSFFFFFFCKAQKWKALLWKAPQLTGCWSLLSPFVLFLPSCKGSS